MGDHETRSPGIATPGFPSTSRLLGSQLGGPENAALRSSIPMDWLVASEPLLMVHARELVKAARQPSDVEDRLLAHAKRRLDNGLAELLAVSDRFAAQSDQQCFETCNTL